MPPTLALILCICFVLFLLHQERKYARAVSPALWIPTLWMLYCGSRPIAAWFRPDEILSRAEQDIESGSAIDRYFLLALIVIGLAILARRRISWSKAVENRTVLIILFVYMGMSVVWSDYSWVSFKRWIRVSGAIVMALIVWSDAAPRDSMEAVLRRCTYILIPFSAVLVKYFSRIGVHYDRWIGTPMWVGVTTQKNGLGRLCLVCGLYLIWVFLRRKLGRQIPGGKLAISGDVLVFGLTLWLLNGCDSVTSMVVLGLGAVVLAGLNIPKERVKLRFCNLIAILIAILFFLTAYLFVNGTLPAFGVSHLGRDATFTGRTEIWAELFPIAWREPILGLGYGSFWIHPPLFSFEGLNEGHNGYLDVVLEIGFAGLLLLSAVLVSFYSRLKRSLMHDLDWSSFGLAFLLVLMVHNFTETSFIRTTSHLWTVFIFLYFVIPRVTRTNSRSDPAAESLPRTEPAESLSCSTHSLSNASGL